MPELNEDFERPTAHIEYVLIYCTAARNEGHKSQEHKHRRRTSVCAYVCTYIDMRPYMCMHMWITPVYAAFMPAGLYLGIADGMSIARVWACQLLSLRRSF